MAASSMPGHDSRQRQAPILFLAGAVLCVPAVRATDTAGAMQVLKANCLSCHSETRHKGGLSLHSRESALKGGENGAALTTDKPDDSLLLRVLKPDADPHMPPKKQLSAEQTAMLTDWVKAGAPWDAAALQGDGAPLRPVSLAALPADYHPVMAMAMSPDGKYLAASSGSSVLLFEVTPAALVLRERNHAHLDAVQSLAWTPDGQRLVSGAFRRVIVWKARPLVPEREILAGLTDRISAIQPLKDGNRAALGDGVAGESGIVRIADLSSGRMLKSWKAHDDTIFAMALHAGGTHLTTAGGDKFIKLWDPETGTETLRIEAHGTQVLGATLHPDNNQLATGGADRQLKIWDLKTRETTVTFSGKPAAFNVLTWTAGGTTLIAGTDDGAVIRISDMKPHTGAQSSETGNERTLGNMEAPVFCVAALPDGTRMFAGSANGRILGWDKDGKQTDDLKTAGLRPAAANP